ncbi:MAG TPA: hypothetical protein VF228_18725 [Iamia sp.]
MGTTWMRRTVATAAVVVAASAGALAAGAAGRMATQAEAPPARAAGTASPTESMFVPITPCRIVNTQNSAGDIDAGELRSYKTNGNTSEQGGAAACGIPASATALELSVSAVSAKGPGYLRVHPAGVATPTATFLNYGPGQNLTNAGTVQVRPGANVTNLSVRAFESDTHVVIDALGYYVTDLFAVVDTGANAASRGNGVVSVANPFSGIYDVVFDRNVSGCAHLAAPAQPGSGVNTSYDVSASPLSGNANGVRIQTFSDTGLAQDRSFTLVVDC